MAAPAKYPLLGDTWNGKALTMSRKNDLTDRVFILNARGIIAKYPMFTAKPGDLQAGYSSSEAAKAVSDTNNDWGKQTPNDRGFNLYGMRIFLMNTITAGTTTSISDLLWNDVQDLINKSELRLQLGTDAPQFIKKMWSLFGPLQVSPLMGASTTSTARNVQMSLAQGEVMFGKDGYGIPPGTNWSLDLVLMNGTAATVAAIDNLQIGIEFVSEERYYAI